jgi:hypothetical protein
LDGERSPGVAQPVLYEDFTVRRINRVELLTVGTDRRLVSVLLVGGCLWHEGLNVPSTIGTAITEWEQCCTSKRVGLGAIFGEAVQLFAKLNARRQFKPPLL